MRGRACAADTLQVPRPADGSAASAWPRAEGVGMREGAEQAAHAAQ